MISEERYAALEAELAEAKKEYGSLFLLLRKRESDCHEHNQDYVIAVKKKRAAEAELAKERARKEFLQQCGAQMQVTRGYGYMDDAAIDAALAKEKQ